MPTGMLRGLVGSSTRLSTVARLGAIAITASVLAAGCGSSSGSGNGGGPFVGRWEIDSPSSSFTLNCQTAGSFSNEGLWFHLVFETGVLTDITETSGVCGQGLALDASSTALSLANPDPYTSAPPVCDVSLGPDSNGNPVFFEIQFDKVSFTLLSSKAGQAQQGVFSASGTGQILQSDATGNFTVADTCTYIGAGDIFHRMTKG